LVELQRLSCKQSSLKANREGKAALSLVAELKIPAQLKYRQSLKTTPFLFVLILSPTDFVLCSLSLSLSLSPILFASSKKTTKNSLICL